jgi:hypothetical protein
MTDIGAETMSSRSNARHRPAIYPKLDVRRSAARAALRIFRECQQRCRTAAGRAQRQSAGCRFWRRSRLLHWLAGCVRRERYAAFSRFSLAPVARASRLRADAVAGATVAMVLIPQSMAYAQLAGTAGLLRPVRSLPAGHRWRDVGLVAPARDRPGCDGVAAHRFGARAVRRPGRSSSSPMPSCSRCWSA